jgi:hypothetical protein
MRARDRGRVGAVACPGTRPKVVIPTQEGLQCRDPASRSNNLPVELFPYRNSSGAGTGASTLVMYLSTR